MGGYKDKMRACLRTRLFLIMESKRVEISDAREKGDKDAVARLMREFIHIRDIFARKSRDGGK
jgi:hypothetical protein